MAFEKNREAPMPKVNREKYPYTAKGKAAARKHRARIKKKKTTGKKS